MDENRKKKIIKLIKKNYWRIILILISSVLQVFCIQSFMHSSNLLSSGFTGLAILINTFAGEFKINLSVSLLILLLNLPVALLCMKSISKRFTILSTIQFMSTSFLLNILHFNAIFSDIMLNCILGGIIYGTASLLALKANGSTGGTDFIALYVANKTSKPTWQYIFCFNCLMVVCFGFMKGWDSAGYSILFQLMTTKTIQYGHHQFDRITLQVTTTKPDEVVSAYIKEFKHGITVTPSYGGFSHKKNYLLQTVISKYEMQDIVMIMQQVDPNIIVNVLKSEEFIGGFKPRGYE